MVLFLWGLGAAYFFPGLGGLAPVLSFPAPGPFFRGLPGGLSCSLLSDVCGRSGLLLPFGLRSLVLKDLFLGG